MGQTHNAKYVCPGELHPNAAKYKPLKQYGNAKVKALFERRDSASSKCSKHNTMREGGRTRITRNISASETTRENQTSKEDIAEQL